MHAHSYSVLATSVIFSGHVRVSLRESIRHLMKLVQKPFKTRVVVTRIEATALRRNCSILVYIQRSGSVSSTKQ
jgi:hypothetical protein